jgi:large subunit ribosomal protein L21
MYAIVDIAGFQFNVEPGKKLYVHRLQGEKDDKVRFDKVLLTDHDGDVKVGTPSVSGAEVTATILQHVKGDKVIVFKKKRRKGYKKKNGHRQLFTQIQIDEITIGHAETPKVKKEKASKPAVVKQEAMVPEAAEPEVSEPATATPEVAEPKEE